MQKGEFDPDSIASRWQHFALLTLKSNFSFLSVFLIHSKKNFAISTLIVLPLLIKYSPQQYLPTIELLTRCY